MQARPAAANHHEQDYFGTLGRRLQQGPPGTMPEEVVDTEADAAMAPMSAMGEPSPHTPCCLGLLGDTCSELYPNEVLA